MKINIAILGGPKTGKKTMITRITTGVFDNNLSSGRIEHNTNFGFLEVNFSLEVNDETDAVIILIDITNPATYRYATNAMIENPHLPKIVCGNKIDVKNHVIKNEDMKKLSKFVECIYTSYRSNFNFEKPYTILAEKIIKERRLIFLN